MADTAERAVTAFFDSAAQAEQAARDLMDWDRANDEIKLGAIGVLTRDDQGNLKTKNLSARNTGKGAKVGMGLGALAAVLSGGLTLIPTAVGGAVGGGLIGTLSKKGLGLSDDDLQQLNAQLAEGHAALLVLCDDPEVEATAAQLVASGGEVRRPAGAVSAESLQEAARAASTAAAAPAGVSEPAAPAEPDPPAPATSGTAAGVQQPAPDAAPSGAGPAEDPAGSTQQGDAYFEEHGPSGLPGNLTGMVRRHPVPVLGGAVATVAVLALLVLLGRRRLA